MSTNRRVPERCAHIAPPGHDYPGRQCGLSAGHLGEHTVLISSEFLNGPPPQTREEFVREEILAGRERLNLLESELLQLRRWACDASVALEDRTPNIGRVRTNVERIYQRLLRLTRPKDV